MGVLAAPTILCVRVAAECCFMQGMVPGIVVLTYEPCLAFLRTPSGSFRVGVPGRMALVGSECAGRRRAVSRVPTSPGRRDAGLESKVGLGAGLPIREVIQRRLKPELSTSVEEVGGSSRRAGFALLGPSLSVDC